MRAAWRSEQRRSACGSIRPISAPARIGQPSLGGAFRRPATSALAADLLLLHRLGLGARPRGRLLLQLRHLGALGAVAAGARATALLAEALLQRLHQIDHLGA